jgi:hypothetical protein
MNAHVRNWPQRTGQRLIRGPHGSNMSSGWSSRSDRIAELDKDIRSERAHRVLCDVEAESIWPRLREKMLDIQTSDGWGRPSSTQNGTLRSALDSQTYQFIAVAISVALTVLSGVAVVAGSMPFLVPAVVFGLLTIAAASVRA